MLQRRTGYSRGTRTEPVGSGLSGQVPSQRFGEEGRRRVTLAETARLASCDPLSSLRILPMRMACVVRLPTNMRHGRWDVVSPRRAQRRAVDALMDRLVKALRLEAEKANQDCLKAEEPSMTKNQRGGEASLGKWAEDLVDPTCFSPCRQFGSDLADPTPAPAGLDRLQLRPRTRDTTP